MWRQRPKCWTCTEARKHLQDTQKQDTEVSEDTGMPMVNLGAGNGARKAIHGNHSEALALERFHELWILGRLDERHEHAARPAQVELGNRGLIHL